MPPRSMAAMGQPPRDVVQPSQKAFKLYLVERLLRTGWHILWSFLIHA